MTYKPPIIIFENIPKLIIEMDSPISNLHKILQQECLRAGRDPLESTICLQEIFNGNPRRLKCEFGIELMDDYYAKRICIGNLHPNIKLGFLELYSAEILEKILIKIGRKK